MPLRAHRADVPVPRGVRLAAPRRPRLLRHQVGAGVVGALPVPDLDVDAAVDACGLPGRRKKLSSSISYRRDSLRGCASPVACLAVKNIDTLVSHGCASPVACPAVEKTCPPFQAAKSFEGWWSLRRFAKIVLLCAMNLRLDRVSGIAPFCGCLNLKSASRLWTFRNRRKFTGFFQTPPCKS